MKWGSPERNIRPEASFCFERKIDEKVNTDNVPEKSAPKAAKAAEKEPLGKKQRLKAAKGCLGCQKAATLPRSALTTKAEQA